MTHPVKVKFNAPEPSRQIIGRHKNFDQFIDRYRKYHTPSGIRYLFKHDIKRLVFIVIIIVLLLILLFSE